MTETKAETRALIRLSDAARGLEVSMPRLEARCYSLGIKPARASNRINSGRFISSDEYARLETAFAPEPAPANSMTVREAATELGVSTTYLFQLIKVGKLWAEGKPLRVMAEDVADLKARKNARRGRESA